MYADWNKLDSDEEDELDDSSGSLYEGKRDVILFCIDCCSSMQAPYDDPAYDGLKSCHLLSALDAVVQIQKKKIIVGPRDSVGILLYNTTRRPDSEARKETSEIKENTYLHQPITMLGAQVIETTIRLIDNAREQGLAALSSEFPSVEDKRRVSMGDVFTTVNWVFRDGAPKTATKRVFLITDQDDPHAPLLSATSDKSIRKKKQKILSRSAETTLVDLSAAGITLEPFFISTDEHPFDVHKFYSAILPESTLNDEEDDDDADGTILPSSISITKIDDLLAQMRFHEVPKRAFFSLPLILATSGEGPDRKELRIGVKGYSLVTEQKKGAYRYFADLGDRLEVADVRTTYIDDHIQSQVPRTRILYGTTAGPEGSDETGGGAGSESEADDGDIGFNARRVPLGARPFYTAAEVQQFRTLGLDTGIKLLGFKDREELVFEDNIKHSVFLFPDESKYSGSRRTFTALLKTMAKKNKVGYVRALLRRNSSPVFCALLPQREDGDTGDPGGFHLIPLPFADDIREATVTEAKRAPKDLVESARQWIRKLTIKNAGYPPDSYPNPALAFHNAQLEAFAFREEFNADAFEDLTEPKYDMVHKRAGPLMQQWKTQWLKDSEDATPPPSKTPAKGTKRKAADDSGNGPSGSGHDDVEIKNRYEDGTLAKLTVAQLKEFLKAKSEPVSGKKAELIERVAAWLDAH